MIINLGRGYKLFAIKNNIVN